MTALTATANSIAPPDSTRQNQKFQMVQYEKEKGPEKVPLLSGYAIFTDLCGLGMASLTDWGQYEVGAHLGIKGRFFPTVEVGLGTCSAESEKSHLHYKTTAPYFRIGMDYNLNKKRTSRNRYYLGFRYGFSSFSYDLDGPDITDPVWGDNFAYNRESVSGSAHWGEILFGLQTPIWQFIHLGWTIRYRLRISESMGEPGHAYYIPGYGTGGESSNTWGGTFNLIFEL